jgi:exonuclease III
MKLKEILFSLFVGISTLGKSDTECPAVPTTSENRVPSGESTFKIMQYNVEWFFIDYFGASDCPGDGCSWKNESEAKIHLEYVSKIIAELNPDIVNFCEVEGCDELNQLVASLGANSGYKPYLKKGTDSATGQNVGMITKVDPNVNLFRTEEKVNYPIVGSKCGYTGPTTLSGVSKHYFTEFNFYEHNILFVGAHFVAFPTDSARCAQREAQAQVLQNVIFQYVSKGYEIMVLGDFNDFDGEIMDSNNNKPTSHVLDIMKGKFGTYSGKYELNTAEEKIPKALRFSDWWDKNSNCVSVPTEFSLIDHILLSPFLNNKIKKVYIYQGYAEFCGTYNSDHYPMIIELDSNI